MFNYCECRQCKRAKRRGFVLGSYYAGSYVNGGLMRVSGYVRNPRWSKGRRPDVGVIYD